MASKPHSFRLQPNDPLEKRVMEIWDSIPPEQRRTIVVNAILNYNGESVQPPKPRQVLNALQKQVDRLENLLNHLSTGVFTLQQQKQIEQEVDEVIHNARKLIGEESVYDD